MYNEPNYQDMFNLRGWSSLGFGEYLAMAFAMATLLRFTLYLHLTILCDVKLCLSQVNYF